MTPYALADKNSLRALLARHHEVSPLMRKGVLRRMITSQQLEIYFMELTSSPYCRYSSSPAEAITPCADLLDLHPSIFPHSSFANSLCLQNRPNCEQLSLPLPPRTVHLGNGRPMQTTLLATFSHNAIGTSVYTRGSTTVTLSNCCLARSPACCIEAPP